MIGGFGVIFVQSLSTHDINICLMILDLHAPTLHLRSSSRIHTQRTSYLRTRLSSFHCYFVCGVIHILIQWLMWTRTSLLPRTWTISKRLEFITHALVHWQYSWCLPVSSSTSIWCYELKPSMVASTDHVCLEFALYHDHGYVSAVGRADDGHWCITPLTRYPVALCVARTQRLAA